MSIVTRLLDHFLMLTFCSTATRVAVAIVIASLLFSSRTVVFAESKVQLGAPSLTSGIPGKGKLKETEIETWILDSANHEVLEFELPLGLSAGQGMVRGVRENPLTRAKIELGRQLFFDTRLSADNTISCASCHQPAHGYAAPTQFGIGIRDQLTGVNSPTSYNRILSDAQFWDGRAGSLEEQAKGPIAAPGEMGNTHEQAVKTVKGINGYQKQFAVVFPEDGVTIDTIAQAIASFERAIITGPSPFDYAEALRPYEDYEGEDFDELKEEDPEQYAQFIELKETAAQKPMSESALRGRELFFSEKTNCTACHVGANLTDEKYHNIGIGMLDAEPLTGRKGVTGEKEHHGAFKTPTIRNVASTPPYMHDGSLATLEEVVEHYVKGGTPNANLSKDIIKLDLTPQDEADLVEFMKACSGPLPKVEEGRLPQ